MSESELITTLRGKIERYLREMEVTYEVTKDTYRFRYESTAVIIDPAWSDDEEETILALRGIVLRNVKKKGNEAMFEEFNELNGYYHFAKIFWMPFSDKPEEGNIWAFVSLLGENLDLEEFRRALVHVATIADEIDDKLQAKYGGEKFEE